MIEPNHIPQAPPTSPGAIRSTLPTRWPMAVGVVCCVFGGLGVLGSLGQFISPLMVMLFGRMGPQFESQMEGAKKYMPETIAYGSLSLIVAILLILLGVRIATRRRLPVALVYAWALVRLPVEFFGVYLQYQVGRVQVAASMNQTGPVPFSSWLQSFITVLTGGVSVLMLVWVCLLPGFLMYWFARRRIREEMAAWPARRKA